MADLVYNLKTFTHNIFPFLDCDLYYHSLSVRPIQAQIDKNAAAIEGDCVKYSDKASDAELNAGVNDNKWVSPKGVSQMMSNGIYVDGKQYTVHKEYNGLREYPGIAIVRNSTLNSDYVSSHPNAIVWNNKIAFPWRAQYSGYTYYNGISVGDLQANGTVSNIRTKNLWTTLSASAVINCASSVNLNWIGISLKDGNSSYKYFVYNFATDRYYEVVEGDYRYTFLNDYVVTIYNNSSGFHLKWQRYPSSNGSTITYTDGTYIENTASSSLPISIVGIYGNKVLYVKKTSPGAYETILYDIDSSTKITINISIPNNFDARWLCQIDKYSYLLLFTTQNGTSIANKIIRVDMNNASVNANSVSYISNGFIPNPVVWFATESYIYAFRGNSVSNTGTNMMKIDRNQMTYSIEPITSVMVNTSSKVRSAVLQRVIIPTEEKDIYMIPSCIYIESKKLVTQVFAKYNIQNYGEPIILNGVATLKPGSTLVGGLTHAGDDKNTLYKMDGAYTMYLA